MIRNVFIYLSIYFYHADKIVPLRPGLLTDSSLNCDQESAGEIHQSLLSLAEPSSSSSSRPDEGET